MNSERKEPGAWRSVEEAVAADEQGADPTPSPLGGNDGVEPAVYGAVMEGSEIFLDALFDWNLKDQNGAGSEGMAG